MAKAKLSTYVYVQRHGQVEGFGPDDDLPEDVARMIGAHAFEGGKHPYPDDGGSSRGTGGPPPKGGSGSGSDAWAQYAAEQGVTVTEGASRDEIVGALTEAGVPVDPQ